MIEFPKLDKIQEEFGKELINEAVYSKAKQDYEKKLVTETKLLEQFKSREGLTEAEVKKLFCNFLVREAIYIALHEGKF